MSGFPLLDTNCNPCNQVQEQITRNYYRSTTPLQNVKTNHVKSPEKMKTMTEINILIFDIDSRTIAVIIGVRNELHSKIHCLTRLC